MGQFSTSKPSRKNSTLRPHPHWKRKASRKRTSNPNTKPNAKPTPNRRKQQRTGTASRTQDHPAYHPPRLQDLQFQNRLKAFRHFADRHDTSSIAAYPHILDGPVASVSGFPAHALNTSRTFLTDTRVGGIPQAGFDFSGQGSAYTGSFTYPGKGASFPVPSPRLFNSQAKGVPLPPGTLLYAGKYDAGLLPAIPVPLGTFNIGSNTGGDASTSGTAFSKAPVKGNVSSKRFKTFRRPHRAIVGARKKLGAPAAPRNTTSFLMRAKKAGGIASFVSPSPVTPAVMPTPVMSPFPPFTGLGDEPNHEWGVDDYGSMNGLIRLRSLDLGALDYGDNNDSESEVEQGAQSVQQLEQRLDHDVSRFVMTYPANRPQDMGHGNLDVQRIDDQDSHIAHLEEENMDLKERLYSMEQEVEDLRRRLRVVEGLSSADDEAEASPERSVANVSCS